MVVIALIRIVVIRLRAIGCVVCIVLQFVFVYPMDIHQIVVTFTVKPVRQRKEPHCVQFSVNVSVSQRDTVQIVVTTIPVGPVRPRKEPHYVQKMVNVFVCQKDIVQIVVKTTVRPVHPRKEPHYVLQRMVNVFVFQKGIVQIVLPMPVKPVRLRKEPPNVRAMSVIVRLLIAPLGKQRNVQKKANVFASQKDIVQIVVRILV